MAPVSTFGLSLTVSTLSFISCFSVLVDSSKHGVNDVTDLSSLSQHVNLLEQEYKIMKQAFLNFKEHFVDMQRDMNRMHENYRTVSNENRQLVQQLNLTSLSLEKAVADILASKNETHKLQKELDTTKSRISHLENTSSSQNNLESLAKENRRLIIELKSNLHMPDYLQVTNDSTCCVKLLGELNTTRERVSNLENSYLKQNRSIEEFAQENLYLIRTMNQTLSCQNYSKCTNETTNLRNELNTAKGRIAKLENAKHVLNESLGIENRKLIIELTTHAMKEVVGNYIECKNETSKLRDDLSATKAAILGLENQTQGMDCQNETKRLRDEFNVTNERFRQLENKQNKLNEQIQNIVGNTQLGVTEVKSLVNSTADIMRRLDITEEILKEDMHQSTYFNKLVHRLQEDVRILKDKTTLQIQEASKSAEEYGLTACAHNGQVQALRPMSFQGVVISYGVNEAELNSIRSTGVFRCEKPGMYMVSLTVKSTGAESWFSIYKNEQYLIDVYIHDSFSTHGHLTFPTASGNTVVYLKKGDEIKVIPRQNAQVFGLKGDSNSDFHDTCISIVKV